MNQGFLRVIAATAMAVAMVIAGVSQGVALANPAAPQNPAAPVEVPGVAAPVVPELMQTEPVTDVLTYCSVDADCLNEGEVCEPFSGTCVLPDAATAPFISQFNTGTAEASAFASSCYYTGNWVGGYWGSWEGPAGDFFREDLFATPLPFVEEFVSAPPAVDAGGGVFGFYYNYFSTVADTDGRYQLVQNPVLLSCDDNVSYNFGVGRAEGAPTAYFGIPTVYDANNNNILTGERRMYLSGDRWGGRWHGRAYFDPDFPEGDNGCKTTKFPNPRGAGTISVCIPGLYLIRLDVNDGGEWFLDGAVPDTDALYTIFLNDGSIDAGWYSAFQDRKETVSIGYVLNSWIYAQEYLSSFYANVWATSGDAATLRLFASGFVSDLNLEYYQKDGPAVVSFRFGNFIDTGAAVADAELTSDAAEIWDNNVFDPELLDAYEEALNIPQDPTTPDVTPLTPDQIVAQVYLPVISQ